jgi:hypothetical protein
VVGDGHEQRACIVAVGDGEGQAACTAVLPKVQLRCTRHTSRTIRDRRKLSVYCKQIEVHNKDMLDTTDDVYQHSAATNEHTLQRQGRP